VGVRRAPAPRHAIHGCRARGAPSSRAHRASRTAHVRAVARGRAPGRCRAADGGHGLNKCAAFAAWAAQSASAPPHTRQIVRLAQAVAKRAEENKGDEDLRGPPQGPSSASGEIAVVVAAGAGHPGVRFRVGLRPRHLPRGTPDQAGWILMNVERRTRVGSRAARARLPGAAAGRIFGQPARFWYPASAAYSKTQWGVNASPRPSGGRSTSRTAVNTTEARTIPLAEMCR
jgi:hypothetical protein